MNFIKREVKLNDKIFYVSPSGLTIKNTSDIQLVYQTHDDESEIYKIIKKHIIVPVYLNSSFGISRIIKNFFNCFMSFL